MSEAEAGPRIACDETAAALGDLVRRLEIDFPAFNRKLSRCDLADCHGVCCHDGVFLGDDEARLIPDLVEQNRPWFESFGLDLPERVVVSGNWRNRISGPKTATRPEPMSELVKDYPGHFPDTACVFLTGNGRCGLQLLSENLGHHPWHFKPATCWMHPLAIVQRAGRAPLLTLHNRRTDPQNLPDYDGFASRTHCGRTDDCGEPASEVLNPELEWLGRLGGRDLPGEIRANPVEPPA